MQCLDGLAGGLAAFGAGTFEVAFGALGPGAQVVADLAEDGQLSLPGLGELVAFAGGISAGPVQLGPDRGLGGLGPGGVPAGLCRLVLGLCPAWRRASATVVSRSATAARTRASASARACGR